MLKKLISIAQYENFTVSMVNLYRWHRLWYSEFIFMTNCGLYIFFQIYALWQKHFGLVTWSFYSGVQLRWDAINPIRVIPGPGRPGLNGKSCQIEMNVLNLFSIGDFSSWSLLYPLKKLFLQYHHKNFEKSGPKVRWLPLEFGKKHELIFVSPHLITYGGTNWV